LRRICVLFLAVISGLCVCSCDLQAQLNAPENDHWQQGGKRIAGASLHQTLGGSQWTCEKLCYWCRDGCNHSRQLHQADERSVSRYILSQFELISTLRALPEDAAGAIAHQYILFIFKLPSGKSANGVVNFKKDAGQIPRWHIPQIRIPPEVLFFEKNSTRSQVWLFIAACILLLIAILLALTRREPQRRQKPGQSSRRRFDQLLAEITSRLTNYRLGYTLEEIRGGLDCLCAYLEIERVSFFVRENGGDHFELLCSSLPGGPDPLLPTVAGENDSWITVHLLEKHPVLIENPDRLPPKMHGEICLFTQNSVKSFAAVPIVSGSYVAGFLALTATQRQHTWPETLIGQVQILGNVLYQAYVQTKLTNKIFDVEQRSTVSVDKFPVMIWMADTDKLCTYVNQGWLDFTGGSLREALGNGWSDGMHPQDKDQTMIAYCKACDARQKFELEYRMRRFDGEYRWIIDCGGPRYGRDGSFIGYMGSCTDVTELKRSEQDLKNLSGRLIRAHEEERKRLARDLHDDFSQQLTLFALDLDKLSEHSSQGPAIGNIVNGLETRIKELSRAMSARSHQLYSSHLEILGLTPAIQAFCADFAKQHEIHVDCHQDIPSYVPSNIALCLFRVLQEAMQNIATHSESKNCRVELTAESNDIVLRIWDSGGGLDTERPQSNAGLAFISMRERLRLVNGKIRMDSAHAQGTQLEIRVPFIKLPVSA
jgi:PAS domain S-box-containing protein